MHPQKMASFIMFLILWHAGMILAQDVPGADTQVEQPDTPSPVPSVPEAPKGPFPCSYTGRFVISPLYCPKTYLSYVYPKCESLRVTLLNKKQLRGKPYRAVWTMNGAAFGDSTISSSIKTYKRSDCATKYLQGIPGYNMRVGALDDEWAIVPVEGSSDCYSSVSLYSEIEKGYLSVSGSCDSFSFEDVVGERQTFEIKSV